MRRSQPPRSAGRRLWRGAGAAAVLVLCLVGPAPGGTAAARELVAAVPRDFPPHYQLDADADPTGFAIEVMNDVARRAGLTVRYRVVDRWAEAHAALRRREVDVIPNMGITEDSRAFARFTRPIEQFEVALFRRSDGPAIDRLDQIAGHRVGTVALSVGRRLIAARDDVDHRVYPDLRSVLDALLLGHVDLVAVPAPTVRQLARDLRIADRLTMIKPPLLMVQRAIAVRTDDPALHAALDGVLRDYLGSPAFQSIYRRWYGGTAARVGLAGVSWAIVIAVSLIAAAVMRWRAARSGGTLARVLIGNRDDPVDRELRRRGLALILVMSLAVGATAIATLITLYSVAFEEERRRLLETVHTQAQLIEAVARFDRVQSADYPGGPVAATLTQIKQGLSNWVGRSEFTLARRDRARDQIVFLVRQRAWDRYEPMPIGFSDRLAEPMRRALIGMSGTIVGPDYRGVAVLAAYEPVAVLDIGVVAKVDIDEIRAPFIEAGLTCAAIGTLFLILGGLLFVGLGSPVVRQVVDQERLFRSIFDQAAVGVALVHGQSGKFIQVNERFGAMLGCAPDRLVSTFFQEVIHPDDLPDLMAAIGRLQHGDTAKISAEARLTTRSGTVATVDLYASAIVDPKGRPGDYILVANDITERRRVEDELHHTHAILQASMDQSPAGIAIVDAPDGRLRYVNDAGLSIRGGDRATVAEGIGINPYAARWQIMDLDGTPLPADQAPLARALHFGETNAREFIVRRSATEDRIVAAKAAPVRNKAGAVVSAIVVFSDVTEQKELERRLLQAQKMEAVGQLTGGVAHDFNNILAVVLGNLELLRTAAGTEAKTVRRLDNAIRAIRRGAELTQRLLAFSRRQALDPKALNLGDLLNSMADMIRRSLGENIETRFFLSSDLWPVILDRSQLENAVLNLAVNARDAMPDGGFLTLEACNVVLDAEFAEVREEVTPGDYVCLSISDTGSGMTPEVLKRAFDPFFTTKEVGRGSGLGLSMVYGFVKQSRGHVSIYSEPGQGTTVRLYLPRAGDDAPRPAAAEDTPPPPAPSHSRILVVEDDPDVRETAVSMLTAHGYRIVEASDGPQALKALEASGPFDLLFTDIVLPGGMTGADLARTAVARAPGLKVVYTTGYSENAVVHHGRVDEGVVLISKPYRMTDLIRTVRRVLDEGA